MQTLQTIADVKLTSRKWLKEGCTIGFVPTMGALHTGHLSLVKRSLKDSDQTIVSIFVNPLQFGAEEDLSSYPRPIEKDLELLAELGVDAVWLPSSEDLYPQKFKTYVDVPCLAQSLCGVARPGHFKGVSTVVCKLLNVVQPTWAYFGDKDFQQLRIIQTMVKDLNMDAEVVACATIREENGLAMSSRNQYLSPQQRKDASVLYHALQEAQIKFQDGVKDVLTLKESIKEQLLTVDGLSIDYIDIVDYNTLLPVQTIEETVIMAAAVFLGQARLIDHVEVDI